MESNGTVTDGMSKPQVDSIVGLSPSISVGQHVTNRNPRSTVGTVTDMYTYLRLIYEKLGERTCRRCRTSFVPSLDQKSKEASNFWSEESSGEGEFVYCPSCQYGMERLTRSHFSFNKPEGACETCDGLGNVVEINAPSVFNEELSLLDGAVTIWYESYMQYQVSILKGAGEYYQMEMDPHLPLKDYSDAQRALLYYGVESEAFSAHFPTVKPPKSVGKGKFEGVLTGMWRRYKEKEGDSGEAAYFFKEICPACHGQRLKEESRLVKVAGASITEISQSSLKEMLDWLKGLEGKLLAEGETLIETFLHDLITKVGRIIDVGLGYLSMDRQSVSLSGGESQRLRLALFLDPD